MMLDIGIGVFLLVCVIMCWHIGFMRLVVGFVAALLSFVFALLLSWPLSSWLNSWFSIARPLAALICIVVVYGLLRLFFFFLNRKIARLKERYKIIDRIDKVFGILMGVAKFMLAIIIFSIVLYLMSFIPGLRNITDWILDGSVIGDWLYELVRKHVVPF